MVAPGHAPVDPARARVTQANQTLKRHSHEPCIPSFRNGFRSSTGMGRDWDSFRVVISIAHVSERDGPVERHPAIVYGMEAISEDCCIARPAETAVLLVASIEGTTGMYLRLWLRMCGALGIGTFNIKVVR
jgi:hypothetical protein